MNAIKVELDIKKTMNKMESKSAEVNCCRQKKKDCI